MIAVPEAWITRARTRAWRLGANVAIRVPRLNRDMAQTKIGRVFILWSRNPVTGMTTDIVRRKAVVNHWTAPAVTFRSCMSRGMATAIRVSLRMTTKVATSRRLMTSRLRPAVSTTSEEAVLFEERSVSRSELLFKFQPADGVR